MNETTPLKLIGPNGTLQVGDDATDAQRFDPKPPKAYVFNDLPERLVGDFDARGWESRSEGFGTIIYSGRVALGMQQFYATDGDHYDRLLRALKTVNGADSTTYSGDNVEFTIWEAKSQVLTVCRRGVRGGTYELTIALGDKSIMEALDLTRTKAQSLIERLKSGPDGASSKAPTQRPTGTPPSGALSSAPLSTPSSRSPSAASSMPSESANANPLDSEDTGSAKPVKEAVRGGENRT